MKNHKQFHQAIAQKHRECPDCPSKEEVALFFNLLLGLLFPNYASQKLRTEEEVKTFVQRLLADLKALLAHQPADQAADLDKITSRFEDKLPDIYQALLKDVDAIYEGDPAANSREEVIRSYPGFYAIAAYRVAHQLHLSGVAILPRMITEHAHSLTGIDIHPGASIGHHFCIDHGTGIVIGETTRIGNHVKIYQGVTLGALSVKKSDARTKRHPTIGNHVVIYAGATILGGKTVIGDHAIIGGNVWITESVDPDTQVHYRNKVVHKKAEQKEQTADTFIHRKKS